MYQQIKNIRCFEVKILRNQIYHKKFVSKWVIGIGLH